MSIFARPSNWGRMQTKSKPKMAQPMRGADGVKIAVLRKGRASLALIRAAAHAKRYVSK